MNKTTGKNQPTDISNTEDRYRAMIDTIADGYYEVDLRGNFTVASNYIERLGYPANELKGMNFGAFVTKDNQEKVFQAFHEVFKTGKPLKNLEFELTTKDGEEKRVSISTALIKSEAGKPTGFRGIFQDITDLVETESLLLEISRTSPIGMYALANGKFIYANQVFLKFTRYRNDELIGREPRLLVHPEDWIKVRSKAITMLKGRAGPPYEFRLIRKDGQISWVMESLWSIKLRGEKLAIGNILDITPLKTTELALKQSEERYRTIIENIQEGYYESDIHGRFTFFNDSFAAILGYPHEELQNLGYKSITDPENVFEVDEQFRRVYETGQPNRAIEWAIISKEGRKVFTEISANVRRDETGNPVGFRGILRDTTERRERDQVIKQLAYYDPLTGLPNRRLFEDRFILALANAERQGHKLALLVMDLDNFKQINDTYGHDTGDLVLKEMGGRLSDLLRKGDTVARMGGDEFIILLSNIRRKSDITIVAKKILRAIRLPFKLGGRPTQISTSIGISICPEQGSDKNILMRQADQAMYQAKKNGNSHSFYSPLLTKKMMSAAKKKPKELKVANPGPNRQKKALAPSNTSPPDGPGQPDGQGRDQES